MISRPAACAMSSTAVRVVASSTGVIRSMISDRMNSPALSVTQWQQIDTVLLDLDGTLLDLAFDNHFWRTHVPQAWAQKRQLELQQALQELQTRFRACEGTLNWYCLDYWSRELELDLSA